MMVFLAGEGGDEFSELKDRHREYSRSGEDGDLDREGIEEAAHQETWIPHAS